MVNVHNNTLFTTCWLHYKNKPLKTSLDWCPRNESVMFDLGYAIASHDETIKEVSSVLVLKGLPEEQIKKIIKVF